MKVAFIGLGNMGLLMSACLARQGYDVWGFDVLPDRMTSAENAGVKKSGSLVDAVSNAEVTICMMPQGSDTRAALWDEGGMAPALAPGSVVIDMSTSSPADTKQTYEQLKAQQVSYLDAPVSGGVGKAKDGTLSIMVAGDQAAYEQVLPILRCLGKEVFYVGPSGNGHTIKLINNMLTGINLAGICEGMILGAKAGLSPKLLLDIINSSSGESYSSRVKIPGFVFQRDFSGGFKTKLQHKDMVLAADLAKQLQVPTPLGNLAKEYYMAAISAGLSELDASAIILVLEHLAGTEVNV